jgi:hypothetical protein
MGTDVELPTYMIAVLVDVLNSLGAGLGGKKLKADDRLTNTLKKDSEQKNMQAKRQGLAANMRARAAAMAEAAKASEAGEVPAPKKEVTEAALPMIATTPAMDVRDDLRKVAELLKDSDLDALRNASSLRPKPQIEDE